MPRRKKGPIKSNYPLRDSTRLSLKSHADALLMRVVRLHEMCCPLEPADIVNAFTTEADRVAWEHLRKRQFGLYTTNLLAMWVAGEDVTVPAKVSFQHAQGARWPTTYTDPVMFDLDTLDDEKRVAFTGWLNAATRQRRIHKGAKAVCDAFVASHCGDSLASLHSRWPGFTVVLLTMGDDWPARARNLTSIKRSEYDWPREGATYDWYLDHMGKMDTISGLLAEGQMLAVPEDKTAQVHAHVVDWKVPVG